MKKIYLAFLLVLSFNVAWSQGENCSAAVLLTNGTCVAGTPGVSQNIVGCVGNADDDSWYRFVATATSHSLTVTGSATYDAVLQFFSGTCSALISGSCVDNTLSGQAESTVVSGLTVGATYYVRVYHYYAGSGAGTFTMCLNNAPAAPANNNCASAINLSVNAACLQTAGTTFGATTQALYPACAGAANDDVWYTFTATNYTQTIQVAGSAGMDAVIELYDGTCAAFTSISCTDNTFSGGTETTTATGLTPGNQYFFRVYDYYSTAGNSFSVCVSGNSIIVGTQPNDEPCGAILLPAVTADCNYSTFSNVGATLSAAVPSPTNCLGGTGGFGATTKDVWFAITVPASGNICITPQPNLTGTVVTDGVMALYTGSCASLTQIACSDDADGTAGIYNYPGTANDFLPYINATGLTPGTTVYLRYWGWGGSAGDFGICVQAPTNDLCANALYICDINGYSASTSPAFTPDRPGTGAGQMFGNNETSAGVDQANGTNTGGIFGYYPFPGTTMGPYSSPFLDVNIENNSWIRFTAASPTIALQVSVYDCWVNTPGNEGVQMQIFSGTNCSSFTPVSSFEEGIGTYTVNATSLTVGNNYYLMVDGWGGNICNYNIQAIAGVAFPAITAVPGSICPGQSSILTAPSGATGYTWAPTGENTQTISVAPGTTMTYTCYVGGVCGYKQTLTKTVNMLAAPSVSINSGAAIAHCGTQTITLTGGGATSYSWSTGSTAGSFTAAPSGSITYSVIGTAVNGCTNTAVSNVTVNTVPTILPAGTNTICNGGNTLLTVSGANTYTWSPSATLSASTGTAVTASPTGGTNYTVTATAANGCTNTATYSVTVNAKPTVSSTTTGSVICDGNSTTVSGTGASTYVWTGGITDGAAFTPTTTATYTVIGTDAVTGCTNSAVRTITVTPTPTVNTTATNSVICNGQSTTLNGTGATTYTWSGGISNGVAFSPTITTTYTVTGATGGCTNTAVRTITVNSLPTVSSTATNSVICNGQSTILNGTGASTYTWTGGVINGAAFSPTTTSTYTVTGTDGNGCVNTAIRTVSVNSLPTSTASTSGTITCATPTVNLNSSLAGASYTWTAPGGSSISGGTANNQNAVGQGSGTYTLTVMSAAGCTYSTTLATNINTTVPNASATNGTLTCAQTSTVLTGGPATGVTYLWSGPGISGSNTTANITATATGNYTLVTTSVLTGCSSTVSAVGTVTNNLTTPTVTAGSNQTITCAAPTVTLTGSATGGSNLSWSNGATTNTTTVGGSGTYTLTATNPGTGCFSTSTVQVAPSAGTPNGIVGSVTNSITCTNTNVAVSITSTSTPISILWTGPGISGANNTASTTVSQGGTYTVVLTNTLSGCSAPYSVVVPTNTAPVVASASVSASASITCNTTSLTLSSSPTGANYSYAWTGPNILSGANTANPVVGTGGSYSVTITNTITGCSGASGTTDVSVPSNTAVPSLSLSATSVTTTCSSPNTTITATSNSNPNTTYTWTAPATGTINNPSLGNPTISGSGTFTVAITNTINGCASAQATVNVSADANIPSYTLSTAAATVNCTTPNPGATITSTVTGLTYAWSPTPATGGNTASPTFTAAGNYTAVITNTVNGCSTNIPVVAVSLNTTAPTALATPASSITCSSASVAISSTVTPATNVTYSWSGPNVISGANTLSPGIGSGGNYVIAMTNTVNGCTNSYTVNVPTNTTVPTMSLSTNAFTTTCVAPSVVISASSSADPTTTYSWTAPSTGTISNTGISNPGVGGSGVFTVTATNSVNGCISAVGTVSITADANIPTFTLSSNAATVSCTVPTPSVSLTTNVTGVTYQWSPAPASGGNTATPTFTANGNYTCVITNTVNNCSTNLPQVAVNINTVSPSLNITPSVSITCSSNTVAITSTANPSTSTYSWTGAGIIGSNTGSSITANVAGTYTLIATDPVNGCSTMSTSSVGTNTTAPTLTATATSSVINCSTTSSTLNATTTLTDTPTWMTPAGAAINPVTATTAGDYTATVTDAVNGCSTSRTIIIVNNSVPPDANAGAATSLPCSSPSVALLGTSTTTDAISYSWSGPAITSGSNTASPVVTGIGTYTLIVTNLVTGCTATAIVNVTQSNVTAAFTADTTIGEAPLTVNFTNGSIGANTYNWDFGNGLTSTGQDPNTVFGAEGTYTVTLIASSSLCSDTIQRVITVENGFTIEIPNVFTPNGDGANDIFKIKVTGVKSAEGSIYNRWGQLLYSWDVLNSSWDGKGTNGENCPDATYFYIIKVIDKKNKEHLAPGYVLIAR